MSWVKVRVCYGWGRRRSGEGSQHLYVSQILPPSPGEHMGPAKGGTSSEPTLLSCSPPQNPRSPLLPTTHGTSPGRM